jgi:hypothetical protein
MKAVVAGWFSSDLGTATTGDLLAMRHVVRILESAGIEATVLGAPLTGFPVNWTLHPGAVDIFVWVCGPLSGIFPGQLRERIEAKRWLAVDVSNVGKAEVNDIFDAILWRDSGDKSSLDLAFHELLSLSPTIGILLAGPQHEYSADDAEQVLAIIEEWKNLTQFTWINLDTKFPANALGQDHPFAVVSQIRNVDALVTTRLHGLVLATALGVPTVVIDQIPGGAKVTAQAQLLGLPVFKAADITAETLERKLQAVAPDSAGPHMSKPNEHEVVQWLHEQLRLS